MNGRADCRGISPIAFSDQILSSGRGVPVTVLVQGSTILDIGALSTTYPLEINQLSIEDGSGITFNSPGHVMTAPLIVDGQFINNGAITLSCSDRIMYLFTPQLLLMEVFIFTVLRFPWEL